MRTPTTKENTMPEFIFVVVATLALYISMKLVLKSVVFAFKSFTGFAR